MQLQLNLNDETQEVNCRHERMNGANQDSLFQFKHVPPSGNPGHVEVFWNDGSGQPKKLVHVAENGNVKETFP